MRYKMSSQIRAKLERPSGQRNHTRAQFWGFLALSAMILIGSVCILSMIFTRLLNEPQWPWSEVLACLGLFSFCGILIWISRLSFREALKKR